MILDTHVHAVEPPSDERPHDPKAVPSEALLARDLIAQAKAAGVDKLIQVVPSCMDYDNRYGYEVVEQYPDHFVGVIIRLDPFAPDAEEQLRAAKAHPKTLGVRFTLSTRGLEQLLIDRELDPFFAAAEKVGMVVQLFAPYTATETLETAQRYPGVNWLIDHMGLRYYLGKDNRDAFRQWPELLNLAQLPNVWIKVSYFPEAASDIESYPYPTGQRYFKELYDSVDVRKLIWGSNYPPVKRVCTYKAAVDFVRDECAFLSAGDRAAIMGGNFMRDFARG